MSEEKFKMWKFLTEDEIIADLLSTRLTRKDKEYIKKLEHADLPKIRGTLGEFIKHTYRLNEVGNPYITINSTSMDMELRILSRIWSILTGKPIPSRLVVEEPLSDWAQEYLSHYNTYDDDFYLYPFP